MPSGGAGDDPGFSAVAHPCGRGAGRFPHIDMTTWPAPGMSCESPPVTLRPLVNLIRLAEHLRIPSFCRQLHYIPEKRGLDLRGCHFAVACGHFEDRWIWRSDNQVDQALLGAAYHYAVAVLPVAAIFRHEIIQPRYDPPLDSGGFILSDQDISLVAEDHGGAGIFVSALRRRLSMRRRIRNGQRVICCGFGLQLIYDQRSSCWCAQNPDSALRAVCFRREIDPHLGIGLLDYDIAVFAYPARCASDCLAVSSSKRNSFILHQQPGCAVPSAEHNN